MQANLANAAARMTSPANRIHYPMEGTVVAVHFPQDATNRSKNWVEYDVMPTMDGVGIIKNAGLALGVHGIVDDEDMILKPAALIVAQGGGEYSAASKGSGQDSDGDRVLVQFINGYATNPIITHVLTHGERNREDALVSQYTGKLEILTPGPAAGAGYAFNTPAAGATGVDLAPANGTRWRHHKINGTHLALDANGDLFVNFAAHPDDARELAEGAVKKKLLIQNEGTDLLRIEKTDSGIEVVFNEAITEDLVFKVGSDLLELLRTGGDWTAKVGDGAVKVAIADHLETFYNALKTKLDAFDAHIHSTGMGPSGPPSPTITADAWDSSIASTKVTIPDG